MDPLTGADDANKPLLSKLLAVPALRARYLTFVREIATRWLDWNQLGPMALRYHRLIAPEVALDTRKLATTEAFELSIYGTKDGNTRGDVEPAIAGPGPGPGRRIALKTFADQRRAYLLERLGQLEGK